MDAEVERLLQRARDAHERRDWAMTYDVFAGLRRRQPLAADDLWMLGDAAWWLGLIREVLEIEEECHERFLAEGRPDRAAMVALGTGFNWFLRGEPEIGNGWVSRARRLLEDLPPGLAHGYLLWLEVNELAAAGDMDGALTRARRLRAMAEELDAPVLASFSLAFEGTTAIRRGETDRGFGLLDEAMLPVLAGRVPPEMAGNLYCQMMSTCHELADVARARRWTEATERWCDAFTSAVMFVGICRVHRTQLLRLQGDWDEAARQAALAAAELAELNVEAVAEARYELGETRRLRGDLAEARASYEAARELGRDPQPGAALLLLAEGHADEADDVLRRMLADEVDPFRRARLLAARVDVAWQRADIDTVANAADELATIAETYRSPGFRTWADRARGVRLLAQGEAGSALSHLRAVLAAYQEIGAAYDVATTRLMIARALELLGDADGAAAEQATADEAFAALGGRPPSGWAAGVSTGEVALPGGLTAREAEILCAVAVGLSNRQVAARLVISEKTVARHLANVFAKIEVSSRTAAAAWAHERGLTRLHRSMQ